MSTLKYFMWEWQHQFQDSAAFIAKRLLDRLDSRLAPDAFLVGFRLDDAPDRQRTCVSPDDCDYQPIVFANISEVTEILAAEDPASQIRYSAPTPPDMGQVMSIRRGMQGAIAQILTDVDPRHVFFASRPVAVAGYAVLVVIRLDRNRYDAHYRLQKGHVQRGAIRFLVGQSLINTTIESYLVVLAEKLEQPDPGCDIFLIRDDSSIYRAAAERLMRAPAWAGGDLMGLPDIYDICNTISLQNYEGAESAGQLVFARKNHPDIKLDIKLRIPVSIRDYGAIRKLLQMGSGKLCLFCDSRNVYGLGTIAEYNPITEDLFVVRFIRRFSWELSHGETVMMHCRDGMPQLQQPGPPVALIRETLQRVFAGENVDQAFEVARSVAEQSHGAMLVVTMSAAAEADRLAKQATAVEPFALTKELVPLVTSIDGAVIIDTKGMCHAIGGVRPAKPVVEHHRQVRATL